MIAFVQDETSGTRSARCIWFTHAAACDASLKQTNTRQIFQIMKRVKRTDVLMAVGMLVDALDQSHSFGTFLLDSRHECCVAHFCRRDDLPLRMRSQTTTSFCRFSEKRRTKLTFSAENDSSVWRRNQLIEVRRWNKTRRRSHKCRHSP